MLGVVVVSVLRRHALYRSCGFHANRAFLFNLHTTHIHTTRMLDVVCFSAAISGFY